MFVLCERDRDGLADFLQANSIQTNVYYPRLLCGMEAFKRYVKAGEKFSAGEKISRKVIALPLYPELSRKKVKVVIEKIWEFFKK
jgi:dTDP-4-amino-4,6-dideoxygalactose transaminase